MKRLLIGCQSDFPHDYPNGLVIEVDCCNRMVSVRWNWTAFLILDRAHIAWNSIRQPRTTYSKIGFPWATDKERAWRGLPLRKAKS